MEEAKRKPCQTYRVSYIKVTYDKNGRVTSTTVKYISKAEDKR